MDAALELIQHANIDEEAISKMRNHNNYNENHILPQYGADSLSGTFRNLDQNPKEQRFISHLHTKSLLKLKYAAFAVEFTAPMDAKSKGQE